MVWKNLAVIGGGLSIIGMYLMDFLPISWTMLIGVISICVIVLLVVNRR